MNQSTASRESLAAAAARIIPGAPHHRRGRSLTRTPRDTDKNLDLFSKNRRTLPLASSDESDVPLKLGGVPVGSAKVAARSGADDLLLAADGGKNDYDWLLTPPGTPLFPPSDGSESQQTSAAPRSSSLVRSIPAAKSSRLSVSQSESNHSSRPCRSNSVSRPSISNTQYNSYSSARSSTILNTSSASVSSYMRPSSPITRSPSTARHSTPSAHPTTSRSSTPSKARQASISASIEKPHASQISRPSSTPSSRRQVQPNSNSSAARSSSRPSTPTRRNSSPSLSMATGLSTSVGRVLSNGLSSAPTSRPSSPGPRVRPAQPIVLPDFSLEAPPNLRTSLPDRPLSAGRSRPGGAVIAKGNTEITGPSNMRRRHSSPIVSRGRLVEPGARGRVHGNGHFDSSESRKTPNISELTIRKPVKSSATTTESTGFGRTISKKSLDMAIRHMDIRSSAGNMRPHSGTAPFPQSIRSATTKAQATRGVGGTMSFNINGSPTSNNSETSNCVNRSPEKGSEYRAQISAKLSEMDIFESSRYEAILLKEDMKNANWLHSVDDKSDPGPLFDNGFEPLPEPFGLL